MAAVGDALGSCSGPRDTSERGEGVSRGSFRAEMAKGDTCKVILIGFKLSNIRCLLLGVI